MPSVNRHVLIVGAVLLLHLAALWALQSGLLHRAVERVVPVQLISKMVAPVPPAPPPPPSTHAIPRPQSAPVLPAAPQPLAVAKAAPSPTAPTGAVAPQPPAPPMATPVAATVAPAAATHAPAPAAAKVELPSSDADYLNNTKAPYPALSKRKGEQGRVLVQVLIGVDGSAHKAEIQSSSGFDRLDQTALATALGWRYVPGKRAGVAEAMWYVVPFHFVLE